MEIQEIKARLTIESVLKRYGHTPEKSGRMRCPFHEDRNPSFQVWEESGRWKCFATGCEAKGGDVIDLIERLEGISTGAAIQQAKAWAKGMPRSRQNGKSQTGQSGPKRVDTEKEAEVEARKLAQKDVLGEVLTYFRKALSRSEPARTYLRDRKLDPSVLDVGYNSGRFHRERPTAFIQKCEKAGLLKKSGSGHRAFASGCVIFPLLDRDGRPVSFYGRSISDSSESRGDHYFLPGRSGLYPGYPPSPTKRLILTEAILDAASLRAIRSKEKASLPEGTQVLALYGTNGWTGEHTEAIQSLEELEEAVLFFDGDEAGEAAAEEVASKIKRLRPEVTLSRVETPAGEDLNSIHAEEGPQTVASLIEDRSEIDVSETAVSAENGSAEGEEEGSSSPEASSPEERGHLDTSNPEWLIYRLGDLKVTVQGGIELEDLGRMRVTLKIEQAGSEGSIGDPSKGKASGTAFRDRLDLYRAARTEKTAERAAESLSGETSHVGTPRLKEALDRLTTALEEYRLRKLEALEGGEEEPKMTEAERQRAEAYLEKPGLLERTGEDIGRAGVVGEEKNRLLMYLAFTSRLRGGSRQGRPLHVLCLAPSGAGKTHLQETVGGLIPEEEKKEVTALTENALYYMGEEELKHKLLLIEDLGGAEETLYPIRELQSKGRLVKSVPIKDPQSGEIRTEELVVEGPVSTAATTTRERLAADNESRALILHLDDSKEQSERVQRYQRRRSAGKIDEASGQEAKKRLRNVQRRLGPVEVRNPYAEKLALPPEVFKQRRANQLYLGVIETITFYHQRQREVKTGKNGLPYVETQIRDIEAANELLAGVLSVKSDELSGAQRSFLENLKRWLAEKQSAGEKKETFRAKEVRRALRVSPSTTNRHLKALRQYGLLTVVGGGRYGSGYEYELTRYGREGRPDAKGYLDETLSQIKEGTSQKDSSEKKTGREERGEKDDSA
jgi:DNA primase/DNA-binding MarR family transcriptional regulator/energy-coupling factor transporter ATP-binding protein EcfA2